MPVRAVISSTARSGHTNFRAATPGVGSRSIGVGCSGSDPVWNHGGIGYVVSYVSGQFPVFDKCTSAGAGINYHVDHPPGNAGVYAWPNVGDYEYMHLGDNPALVGIHDPVWLNMWAQRFWALGNGGAGGEILLWTLQPLIDQGERQGRSLEVWMDAAQAEYDRAQDYCNARMPAGRRLVRQIPGLPMFRRFYEDQKAGLAPSANWFFDLYADGFHLVDAKGSLLAQFMSAACMYGIDPAALPPDTGAPSGFTPAEVAYVKKCVSQTIKGFSRAGVDTSAWAVL